MPSPFPSTAEQVVAAVEAAVVNAGPTDAAFVAEFADMPQARAESALAMAADLGLLEESSSTYVVSSPLCRFLIPGRQDMAMAAMRIVLESYRPFRLFRARLGQAPDGTTAARHTQTTLGLSGHRDEVRDTLVSLGTFAHALEVAGGGQYGPAQEDAVNSLATLAAASNDAAAAEGRIRAQIGEAAAARSSQADVLSPLADALLRAGQGDAAGAVQQAGNAVEAYLVGLASRTSVSLTGAHGLNAKVERFSFPGKLKNVSKYLGHIRNAADHGPDPDVSNQSWQIRPNTGTEYVFVACSFIASVSDWETGAPPTL